MNYSQIQQQTPRSDLLWAFDHASHVARSRLRRPVRYNRHAFEYLDVLEWSLGLRLDCFAERFEDGEGEAPPEPEPAGQQVGLERWSA